MESENLIIRKSVFDDCEIFTKWEQQDYVKEFLTINKERTYEEVVREFITREQDPSKEQYTIILKNKGPIGRVYLSNISREFDFIDITRIYIGEKKYLGKGYGRECMEVLLDYCFNELKMERVTLDHYTGNLAGNLYLKLGFKYEGIMRHSAKKDCKYYDLHLMSMLREEYKNIQIVKSN
ncbi:MAG: GNAT family N-acetyltransferase [Tissierellia bacterium]|nr:GNAT family N-acetyltransferase [Tissierellia bacterium]